MAAKLVVFGSTNWDMSMRLPTIPRAKETVRGGQCHFCLGGKGANQAVAAAKAGGEVLFVSGLGDDAVAEQVRAELAGAGLASDGLLTISGSETGKAMIFVDAEGENCIGVADGANAALLPSHLAGYREQLQAADFLLLQLEIPMATVTAAAQLAKSLATQVILNPAPAAPLPAELLACVDILTPNQIEIAQITGLTINSEADLHRAADQLLAQGLSAVLVTLGGAGVFVASREERFTSPAYTVPVVDTTAAGDVFNGALAVALAEGGSLGSAVQFASAAAALSVTMAGALPSIPSRTQIENFMGSATATDNK
ncbi:ribokinase [Halioxenophilus sp. WMMB6]|uniref:ribokinase n=1 Tax=Halioxenophilus sp. WMMB6 TaxID=3073815 RepID=UPI00295E4792|nr:ribokinase [Halioxenophilus sp. WMMB6]